MLSTRGPVRQALLASWLLLGSDIRRHRQVKSDLGAFLLPVPPLPGCTGWPHPPVPATGFCQTRLRESDHPALVPSYLKTSLLSALPHLYRQTLYDQMSLFGCTGVPAGATGWRLLVLPWLSLDLFHAFDGHSVGIYPVHQACAGITTGKSRLGSWLQ